MDGPASRKPKAPKSCHERALGLLAVRARSRRELERRLLQAGFETDEVADVVEGVAPDIVEATVSDAGDEDERAEALARSKADRLGSVDPVKAFSRLTSLLVRRGYSPEVARQAARRALALDADGVGEDGGNLASGFTRP